MHEANSCPPAFLGEVHKAAREDSDYPLKWGNTLQNSAAKTFSYILAAQIVHKHSTNNTNATNIFQL